MARYGHCLSMPHNYRWNHENVGENANEKLTALEHGGEVECDLDKMSADETRSAHHADRNELVVRAAPPHNLTQHQHSWTHLGIIGRELERCSQVFNRQSRLRGLGRDVCRSEVFGWGVSDRLWNVDEIPGGE